MPSFWAIAVLSTLLSLVGSGSAVPVSTGLSNANATQSVAATPTFSHATPPTVTSVITVPAVSTGIVSLFSVNYTVPAAMSAVPPAVSEYPESPYINWDYSKLHRRTIIKKSSLTDKLASWRSKIKRDSISDPSSTKHSIAPRSESRMLKRKLSPFAIAWALLAANRLHKPKPQEPDLTCTPLDVNSC